MKIQVAPYPVDVEFIFDEAKYIRKYKKLKGVTPELSRTDGCTYYVHESYIIVGIFNKDVVTLVHEINHIAIYTLGYVGLPITDESSEAFTYVVDYLLREAIKELK